AWRRAVAFEVVGENGVVEVPAVDIDAAETGRLTGQADRQPGLVTGQRVAGLRGREAGGEGVERLVAVADPGTRVEQVVDDLAEVGRIREVRCAGHDPVRRQCVHRVSHAV